MCSAYSQCLQEREQLIRWPVASGWRCRRREVREGTLFDREVGVQVGGGGSNVCVPEPEGNDGRIDACVQKCHGAGMPEDVGAEVFSDQRRTGLPSLCGVALDGIDAQPSAGPSAERRIVALSGSLDQPHVHD